MGFSLPPSTTIYINCTEIMGFILLQRSREYLLEPGRWRELESTLSFCRARLTQALRFCLSPALHAQSLTVSLLERKAFCLLLYVALETSAHSLETLECWSSSCSRKVMGIWIALGKGRPQVRIQLPFSPANPVELLKLDILKLYELII